MNKNIILIIFLLFLSIQCTKSYSITKQSKLAGSWYPANTTKLLHYLSSSHGSLQKAGHTPLIIVPHAGYMYSAHVAVKAYSTIANYKPDIIIIIGPSHYDYFNGFALPIYDAIQTPLGTVIVDQKIIKSLSHNNYFSFNNTAYEPEHSIEIQLPFIQHYFPGIPILPILTGNVTLDETKQAAQQLLKALAHYKNPLFVISSDFTHHGPRFGYTPYYNLKPDKRMEYIKTADMKAIEYIVAYNSQEFNNYCKSTGITICGHNAILFGLLLFSKVYTKELAQYATSAQVTADYDNTVSYAAIVLTGETHKTSTSNPSNSSFDLSNDDKKFLLTLARQSIETMLNKHKLLEYKGLIPHQCKQNAGAFVTITIHGNLRGCVGCVEPIKPLYQTIIECATNAAFKDSRFEPLTNEEFKKIHIEISVLSSLKKIQALNELSLGKHGIMVVKGNRRGVLLPQVATQFGFSKDEFFHQACQKAGIYPFEYNDVIMYSFTATIFDEESFNQ